MSFPSRCIFITCRPKQVTFVYIEVKNNKLESGLSYCGVLLWHPYELILSNTAKYCRQVLKVGLLMKCMTLHFCIVLLMFSRVTYSSLCSRFKSCLSCAAWLMFVLFALCIFFIVSSWPQEKKKLWRIHDQPPSAFLMEVLTLSEPFADHLMFPLSHKIILMTLVAKVITNIFLDAVALIFFS